MLGSEGNKLDGPTALNLIQTLCESRIDLATLRLDGNPLGTPEAPCLLAAFRGVWRSSRTRRPLYWPCAESPWWPAVISSST